ncbi:MAG: hypothetical protein EPN61_03130 [Burkholderiaceae bacterium]|nr:MAG: hypothetical protein EPN61_03130 [Burkholderiaceae bacterium]
MRFLLLLVTALIGVWLWRSHRAGDETLRGNAPPSPPLLQDMVRCPVCSVHVPKTDAVVGQRGLYCCAEHRRRAEG